MPFRRPESFNPQQEKTHRTMILDQINRCNQVISNFNASEEVVDEKLGKRTYVKGGAEGKAIALSVRCLLSVARIALPKEFFERLSSQNKYKAAFEKVNGEYRYLSEKDTIQFDAIMKILDFYDEVLAAIFSLEDFSDIRFVRENKQRIWGNTDDEDELFSINY